jgi:uncharacterized protein (DUF2336 family)
MQGFAGMTISRPNCKTLRASAGRASAANCALTEGLFEPEQELSMKERELFDDIVERVLDDIEPLARQELAERLASRADAPHRVVFGSRATSLRWPRRC